MNENTTTVEADKPQTEVEDMETMDIEVISYSDMSAVQLAQVLFQDMGSEVKSNIQSMTAGLKLKLDMLDELKENLVVKYPEIRPEVLTAKLANALAVTKVDKGSSLAITEGNLAVYQYMATERVVDSKNFAFLAEIGADKTMSLEILILQSAFRSYREAITKGELPTTSSQLNLSIMKMTSGILPITEKSRKGLEDLF